MTLPLPVFIVLAVLAGIGAWFVLSLAAGVAWMAAVALREAGGERRQETPAESPSPALSARERAALEEIARSQDAHCLRCGATRRDGALRPGAHVCRNDRACERRAERIREQGRTAS